MSISPAPASFETRLLAELRQVVAERAAAGPLSAAAPTPAAPHPSAPSPPAPSPSAPHPAARQAGRGWPGRRLVITGALSATVAAGVAVALTVALPDNGQRPAGPHFAAATTVAAVLNNAALAAQSEPAVTPRPDQFVYLKLFEVLDYSAANRRATAGRGDPPLPSREVESTESWLSVSGTRQGLSVQTGHADNHPARTYRAPEPFCQDGVERAQIAQNTKGGFRGFPCTPQQLAAYKPWLPSTAAGMLAYLAHLFPRKKNTNPVGRAGSMIVYAFGLLTSTDLTPAQQAAMFHALAKIPHLRIVPKLADALGRTGVGIRLRDRRDSYTVIFDPRTFRPLGETFINPAIAHREALVVPATVVDQAGQRP